MKRIEGIKDLEQFGIIPLTGESDAHMYRILCDVTLHGKRILERYQLLIENCAGALMPGGKLVILIGDYADRDSSSSPSPITPNCSP